MRDEHMGAKAAVWHANILVGQVSRCMISRFREELQFDMQNTRWAGENLPDEHIGTRATLWHAKHSRWAGEQMHDV